MKSSFLSIFIACLLILLSTGCNSVDFERIPYQPVNIDLSSIGMWNSYGIGGLGEYRYFTLNPRQPANFPYTAKSEVGFGGILLIGGQDPYASSTFSVLAYDLACPVERKSTTRVTFDPNTLTAKCPECGSRYDVFSQLGNAIEGLALTEKYGLRSYPCVPGINGGYIIKNY